MNAESLLAEAKADLADALDHYLASRDWHAKWCQDCKRAGRSRCKAIRSELQVLMQYQGMITYLEILTILCAADVVDE